MQLWGELKARNMLAAFVMGDFYMPQTSYLYQYYKQNMKIFSSDEIAWWDL